MAKPTKKQRVALVKPGSTLPAAKRRDHHPGLATALHAKRLAKQASLKGKVARTPKKQRAAAGEPGSAVPPVDPQSQPLLLAAGVDAVPAGKQAVLRPSRAKGLQASKRGAPAAGLAVPPVTVVHEDRLARLHEAVQDVGSGKRTSPRTTRLLAAGVPKMAQKVVEEAAEVAIEAVQREPASFVIESADLLYNLVVLWSALGVTPGQVWAEMDRREAMLGMAEKLPKAGEPVE